MKSKKRKKKSKNAKYLTKHIKSISYKHSTKKCSLLQISLNRLRVML